MQLSMEEYARKRTHNGCLMQIESPNTQDNCLASLGKPRDAEQLPSVTKWIKSCLLQCFGTFKMPILMFISILVFRPKGQIWNPIRRDTRIYVRRILNASRISKAQLNSCTISPS